MKKFEKKDFIDIMPSHAGEYGNIKVENDCMKGFSPWSIPCYTRNSGLSLKEISNIKRANRYLKYIQRKLIMLSREGETKKVAILGDILMRRSVAFQVMVINKAERGGTYKYEGHRMLRAVKTALRGIRNKRESLVINRSYILKSNGKFRPIGSPNIQSKILLTALEKILRIIIEPKLGDYQHGFRNGRSAQTAGRQIIERYRKGNYFAYEFDLKSFFNMINVQLVCSRLNSIAPGLGNWVKATTFETNPIFKEYQEEKEIERIKVGKNIAYRKRGFTQGSPCAPLLSIGALEFAGFSKIPGLTMYADDGVIMSETADGIKDYLGVKSNLAGVYLAEDKNYGLVPRLKFLGLTLNTLNGTITDGKKTVCIMKDSKDLEKILSYASYEKKEIKYHGLGEVKPRSLQGMRRITTKLHMKITMYIYKVTMETLNSIKPELLNPNQESNVIGKGLQKGGEEHISGQPKSASTYGSAKMIEYLRKNSNLKKKNVRISDYVPSESSSSGTDFKIVNDKIFIRYPHNGGTLGHEDERISNLFPSNFYKIAKDDA